MGDYLRAYRLEEVIRLIQVTGLGTTVSPGNAVLNGLLAGPPKSLEVLAGVQPRWVSLAVEHPEFFRPNQGEKVQIENQSVTLVARLYQNGDGGNPPLPWERIKDLIDAAIKLHECQARSHERRKDRSVLIVAIITTTLSALSAIVSIVGIVSKK